MRNRTLREALHGAGRFPAEDEEVLDGMSVQRQDWERGRALWNRSLLGAMCPACNPDLRTLAALAALLEPIERKNYASPA